MYQITTTAAATQTMMTSIIFVKRIKLYFSINGHTLKSINCLKLGNLL
jgi:hypothetical protein